MTFEVNDFDIRFLILLSHRPHTVCEVGNCNGCAAESYRLLGKSGYTHPRCGVVNVYFKGLVLQNCVEEAVELKPVHAVVRTLNAALLVCFPDRVLILFGVLFGVAPVFAPAGMLAAVEEYRVGRLLVHSLCASDGKASAVVTGKSRVEGESYRFTAGALDYGRDDIALIEVRADKLRVVRLFLHDVLVKSPRFRRHRDKGYHSVSSVYAENLGDRSEFVSRIVLAVAVYVVAESVVTPLFAERNLFTKVVHIAAGAVDNLSENAEFNHVSHHKLASAVATVLKEHERHAGSFDALYKLEALLDGVRSADLHADLFACLESGDCNRNMRLPRTRYDHGVNVVTGYNVSVVVACEGLYARLFLNELCALGGSVGVDVAHCRDLRLGILEYDIIQKSPASWTETHKSYSYLIHTVIVLSVLVFYYTDILSRTILHVYLFVSIIYSF